MCRRKKDSRFAVVSLSALILVFVSAVSVSAARKIDFNDGNIRWHNYSYGMELAKATRRPVLLIIYTDW